MNKIIELTKSICFVIIKDKRSKDLELIALRQQLANYKAKKLKPNITQFDRCFWIILKNIWPNWKNSLVIVDPKTVVAWHRKGFRLFWKWESRSKPGRSKIDQEIRALILKIQKENGWGAPKIHAELLKLGLKVSEATVSKYLVKIPSSEKQLQNWRTFLNNHMHNTVSMDFFVVPTITFKFSYCLILIMKEEK